MRKFFFIVAVVLGISLSGVHTSAQISSNPNFHKSDLYVGPRVGLGGFGGAGFGLGANVEYGLTPNVIKLSVNHYF